MSGSVACGHEDRDGSDVLVPTYRRPDEPYIQLQPYCNRDVIESTPASRALHALPVSGVMLDTEAQAVADDDIGSTGASAPAASDGSQSEAAQAPNAAPSVAEPSDVEASDPAAEASTPAASPAEQQQQVDLSIVRTAQEFHAAVERGDAHIEVHGHLDLRQITEVDKLDRLKGLLGVLPATIQSIRGNCKEPPETSGSWNPPLIPRLPRQCLLIVNSGLLTVARSELWLDGLYVRLGPELSIPEGSNIARTAAELELLSRPHGRRKLLRDNIRPSVPQQMVRVDGRGRAGWQGRLWMTAVTIQGDGAGPAADLEHGLDIISQAYAEACMFVDMDAVSVVTVETSGARGSFVDCIFARNHIMAVEKQVRLGILTGRGDSPDGAAVSLQGCSFISNNATYDFLAQNDCTDDEGGNTGDSVFYSDDDHELTTFCKGGGAFEDKPIPLAQIPSDSGFLSTSDPWFQDIQQKLPFVNRTVSQETQQEVEQELVSAEAPALAPGAAQSPSATSGSIHPLLIAAINIGVTLVVAAVVAGLLMMHRRRSRTAQEATGVTVTTHQSRATPGSSSISTALTRRATTQDDLMASAPDCSTSATLSRLHGHTHEPEPPGLDSPRVNPKGPPGGGDLLPNLTSKLLRVGSQEMLDSRASDLMSRNASLEIGAKNAPESHGIARKSSLASVEMSRVASWDSLYGGSSLALHSTRNASGIGQPNAPEHPRHAFSATGGRISRPESYESLSSGAAVYKRALEGKHSRDPSHEALSGAATTRSPSVSLGAHSRHSSHDMPQGTPWRSPGIGAQPLPPIPGESSVSGGSFGGDGALGDGHRGVSAVSMPSAVGAVGAGGSGSPDGEEQKSPASASSSEDEAGAPRPTARNLFDLVPTEDSTAGHTRDGVSLAFREPPPADAPDVDRLAYVHYQLHTLDGQEVLGGLVLQEGSSCRLQGGQAVIQFATEKLNGLEYAIKFFVSLETFKNEAAQYTDAGNPLRQFLPRVRDQGIVTNTDGVFLDGNQTPMPPCIVMEKGESLDVWVQRNRRVMDQFTAMQIIYHICECLMDLHGAGYVHRDLKPGNIMWLPSQNRWTLIDFGCAAKIGSQARMGFSVMYAAPEVVRGHCSEGQSTVTATTALDAWALGVLAVEMFSGRPALRIFEGREQVIAQILGEQPLPWESEKSAKKILRRAGKFKGPVLELLKRNPDERPSIESFVMQCSNILSSTTQLSEESGDLLGVSRSATLPFSLNRTRSTHGDPSV